MRAKFEEKFMAKLNLFKEYVEEFHELPTIKTIYKDVQLGQWIQNQKSFLKSGKLPEERIKLLNDVNPFWNASSEEKKIENKRLMLSSDWKSKVPVDNTPIDVLYNGDMLYKYISQGIYDCETLIKRNAFLDTQVYEVYSKIISIDPQYALLLAVIYAYDAEAEGFESTKEFFNNFIFTNKEEMIEKMNKMLESLSSREREVIELRFGLKDGRRMYLDDVGKVLGVTRHRIRQIECKSLRILRRQYNRKIIEETGTVLDNFTRKTRMKLYHAGINSIEKIEYSLENYIITDHEIRAELEKYLAHLDKKDKTEDLSNKLDLTIDEIITDVRSYNCLRRAGINTIGQLKEFCDDDPDRLLKIRNMGKQSAIYVCEKLNELLDTNYKII